MDKNTIIGFLLLSLVIFGYYSIYPPQNPQTNLEDEIIQQENIINDKIIDQKENINNKNEIIELTQDTIDEKIYSIENNLIKLNISNDGGYINSLEIKKFKTYDHKKLILFDNDSSYFNIKLFTNNGTINSKEIFFKSLENKVIVEKDKKESLILKFEISENQYLEFI